LRHEGIINRQIDVARGEEGFWRGHAMADTERFEVKQQPDPFGPEPLWINKVTKFADVTIRIYNTSGRLVRTVDLSKMVSDEYSTKELTFQWDGKDDDGNKAPKGVYFCHIQDGEISVTRKMVIMDNPSPIQDRIKIKKAFRVSEPPGISNRGLMLNWQPDSQKNKGWNVYRSETATGQFVKVNNKLLKASDKPYYFIDVEMNLHKEGTHQFYRLESVRTDGSSVGPWALVKMTGSAPNPFGPDWGTPIAISKGEDQFLWAYDTNGKLVWTMAICYRQEATKGDSNRGYFFWLDGRSFQSPGNIAYYAIQRSSGAIERIEAPNKLMNYIDPSLMKGDTEAKVATTQNQPRRCVANILSIIRTVRYSVTRETNPNLPPPGKIYYLSQVLERVVTQDLLKQHPKCPYGNAYTIVSLEHGCYGISCDKHGARAVLEPHLGEGFSATPQTWRKELDKRVAYLFDGDLSILGEVEKRKIELTPKMEKMLHQYSIPVDEIKYTRFADYRIVGSDKLTEHRALSKLIVAEAKGITTSVINGKRRQVFECHLSPASSTYVQGEEVIIQLELRNVSGRVHLLNANSHPKRANIPGRHLSGIELLAKDDAGNVLRSHEF